MSGVWGVELSQLRTLVGELAVVPPDASIELSLDPAGRLQAAVDHPDLADPLWIAVDARDGVRRGVLAVIPCSVTGLRSIERMRAGRDDEPPPPAGA